MGVLSYDEHQELLNELAGEEPVERSRLIEIGNQLRDNYVEATTTIEKTSETVEKFKKENYDLVVSNSQMFRQLGSQNASEESKKEQEEKSISESITLEALEGAK